MPVATVRMFGSKMMSSAGKPTFSVSSSYARRQMRTLSSTSTAWPLLVERHHDDRRAVPAAELRAAQELGLAVLEADRVDDRLALQRLEAGFDHRPLAAVDHHRHGGDVVLAGDQPQVLRHHGFAVEQRFVHVDVDDVRPAGDLLRGRFRRLLRTCSSLISRANFLRAGDVRPLADHQEVAVGAQRERPRAAEPQIRRDRRALVRLDAAQPRRRSRGCGRASCRSSRRRCSPSRARRTRPACLAMAAGPRSYWPISFGRPALGWQLIQRGETCCSVSKCGRISSGPSAQFMPTESIGKWATAFQNASTSCPETNVAPPLSNVPEIITGTRTPLLVEVARDREQARLQIERVDHRFREAECRRPLRPAPPPARSTTRPSGRTSRRDSWRRRPCVLMAVCFVVGPIEPATNRGRSGVRSRELVAGLAGQRHGRRVDLAHQLERQVEFLHAERAGAERVRLDDVGPGREVAAVNVA